LQYKRLLYLHNAALLSDTDCGSADTDESVAGFDNKSRADDFEQQRNP
jgi:hypothetical protein